ncbi:two-component regulator propeller domain-containing protein [Bacteroides caecigallinarum]|nr:two-component regulator propeller domain-containing protein [Bacteroides caecigallinarum]
MRLYLSIVFIFISIFTGFCQKYQFKHIDVSNGLPNNFVRSIYKDKDGFMWFGTQTGLCRYDGYDFKYYFHKDGDNTTIPDNTVLSIQETNDNNIIVETMKGYAALNKVSEKFSTDLRHVLKSSNVCNISKLHIQSDDKIWTFSADNGGELYCNDKLSVKLDNKIFSGSNVTDIKSYNNNIIIVFNYGQIVCINSDNNEIKWINTDIPKLIKSKGNLLFYIFIDKEGLAWIYSTEGLWVFNLENLTWEKSTVEKIDYKNDVIHCVAQDNKGKIWIGKDYGGIEILDKESGLTEKLHFDEKDERSISQNTVYAIYNDRNGLVWIGTYKKGISYYGENIFKFGMSYIDDITSIEQINDSILCLGTNGNGIILWNNKSNIIIQKYNTENAHLVTLHKSGNGDVWGGTFNGGLIHIKGNTIERLRQGESKLRSNNIWSIIEDNKKGLYLGFIDAGIQYLNMETKHIEDIGYYELESVTDLLLINDKELLVGTSINGCRIFNIIERKVTDEFTEQNKKLNSNSVNHIFRDSNGLVWIGTQGGMNVYNPKTRRTLKIENNILSESFISAITEDNEGNIWISAARKVIRIDSINIQNDRILCNSVIYNRKDGLQNCDFNLRSIKKLDNGEIVLGGLYGLNIIQPANMHYNTILPKVNFTGLTLSGKPVEIGEKMDEEIILNCNLNYIDELRLKYDQNIFAISLSTDSYILPEKTRYMYKLEGLKDEWVTLSEGIHDITFTYLEPGNYTLKVKAINSDGCIGDKISELKIKILPPFWLSWWAFTCYTIIAVLLLLYFRYRLLKHEREKFRLQQIEQEARKNEEINNMKFKFFTNISHELRTPLTLIIAPLEDLIKNSEDSDEKKILQMMNRNAQRLLMLVNQLLDFRKGEMSKHKLSLSEGDIVTFIHGVCDSFLLMAEKKDIQFSFFSGVETFSMAFDADKIGKIIMNLLSNAFKFTPRGGRINVIIDRIENENILEIRVSDTGIGISDADKEHIFDRFYQSDNKNTEQQESTGTGIGLSLVRDFVMLHEGKVNVFDNIGKGSVFVVHIPIRHVTNTIPEEPVAQKVIPDMESIEKSEEKENKPLLMIVDDNEDFRTYLKYSLELQYRIKLAANGQEAWDMIINSQKMPDLIISDVMMPVMDGNTLCKKIKGDKRTSNIPVILLSARHATESKLQGLELGADDYVTKPFNISILVLRIRKLIELSRYNKSKGTIDPSPSEIVITSLDEKLIEKAIKYVEDNISRSELSVEELSSELGMSRVHLYKKLLQITGKTPIEFIRVIRLKRAAQLLRESQLHVSEVAFEVGFNNPKYFSRYFKEEFGVLPSVYQEKKGK